MTEPHIHRPVRLYEEDNRGRTRLVGSLCRCGAIYNTRMSPARLGSKARSKIEAALQAMEEQLEEEDDG